MPHLDSRRRDPAEQGLGPWADLLISLDDRAAVEASPFRSDLEALAALGFTAVVISQRGETAGDNPDEWTTEASRTLAGTELMSADGKPFILTAALIGLTERHSAQFQGGDVLSAEAVPEGLSPEVWTCLQGIHRQLTQGSEGTEVLAMLSQT